jgi:hypothetical protein
MGFHTGSSLQPDANPPGQQNPPGRRRHRYRIFSVAFKLHVVEYAQHHSICTTAGHFVLIGNKFRATEKLLVSIAKWRLSYTTSY